MENLIFFTLIFSFFLNFSFGAMKFSSINRTFLLMYKGIPESSIGYVSTSGTLIEPYFIQDILEDYVVNYFQENLTRYVEHYEASIYYFDPDTELMCTSAYCKAVRISLECDINLFFHYAKARDYIINE